VQLTLLGLGLEEEETAQSKNSEQEENNEDEAMLRPSRQKKAKITGQKTENHVSSSGNFVRLFISRPVFAFVVNALIIVAGLAAMNGVDVRELPDIDRPIVTIATDFRGAAAETVDREITQVIEDAAARVSGVKAISSRSSFARSRVTVEFNDGVDLNVASADIRDAISRIVNQLPDDADASRIIKADSNADAVMRLALMSEDVTIDDLTVLAEDQIIDILSSVSGVADVQIYGARDKIFRIDINQERLSAYGLTLADISRSLNDMALDAPAGSLRSADQSLVVRATATLSNPQEFENVYITPRIRLGDVAQVTLGPDIETSTVRANGQAAIGMGIIRQAQSNTLDISTGIKKAVEQLNETLPNGVSLRITSDDANFINGAIHEVEIALFVAISSVIVVIFLFLWDGRATLIPALSIPVTLIGTIAAIYLAGFSINILTLLALVLATGLVVDDAIVVLENIVRQRNLGLGRRAAAFYGTREVFFAVIATTLTLAAVFVPISFMPGQAGGLFREFGFVLAIAVLLSALVALTLCPMLASRLLKEHKKNGATSSSQKLGYLLGRFYHKSLHFCLNWPLVPVLVACLFAAISWGGFKLLPQELTPEEDRSFVFMRVSGPQGISVDYLKNQLEQIEVLLQPLRESGEIISSFSIAGSGGSSNNGFLVLTLASWGERERLQQQIVADINQAVRDFPAVRLFVGGGNSLGIRGAGSGLQFALLGQDYDMLRSSADKIIASLQDDSRFFQPRLSVDNTQPQLFIDINRARASDLAIDITGLAQAVQSMLDGRRIGAVYIADRAYDVKLVSSSNPINDPTDVEGIFIRTGDNRFVPMSSIADISERPVPPELQRERRMRAITLSTGLMPAFALGDAYAHVLELAAPHLPAGSFIIPLAEAATLDETTSSLIITFGFALIVILLVLAAQFESFVSGFIVMATVPLGLGCAVIAMLASGTSLNVYSQIGLVLLVGIMAKNGILIVEFADQLRNKGLKIREAIEQAANVRLRPVSMTMICTILGGVPLVLASGAGAEARIALGGVIVGGLGLATIATLYITPVIYLLLARFVRPRGFEQLALDQELSAPVNSPTHG